MSIIVALLFSWIFAPGYVPYGFDSNGNYIGTLPNRPHAARLK